MPTADQPLITLPSSGASKSKRWSSDEVRALLCGKEKYTGHNNIYQKKKNNPFFADVLKDRTIVQMRSKLGRIGKSTNDVAKSTNSVATLSVPSPQAILDHDAGVDPDINIGDIGKAEYRDKLELRSFDIESLLVQLQCSEEWRSVTDHGRFNSDEFLSLYLQIDK